MKRSPLPDLLKGIIVFLIIPVHILETFIDYPGRESIFGKTLLMLGGPIGVPVFMMVMGYFIASSKKSTSQNLIRGIKVLFLGLLLNIGLNFNLLLKIKYKGWQFQPLEYILGVDIFYLAGLSIIILSLLKRINRGQVWIVFVLILLISGSTSYVNNLLMIPSRNYVLPFIGGEYPWAYFPLFPWLTYPLIGFFFYKTEKRIMEFIKNNKSISIVSCVAIFALVLLFSEFGISITTHLSEYYHHTFLFFLWAMGVVILWSLLLRFWISKFPNFIVITFFRWLGKNITLFYVIQWLIIGNISTEIYQTQNLNTYWYWFGGIFTITVVLTWLIGKTNIKLAR